MADWWKDLVTGNKTRNNLTNTVNSQFDDKMPRVVTVNNPSNAESGKSPNQQQLSFTSKLVKTTKTPNNSFKLNSSVRTVVSNEKQVQLASSSATASVSVEETNSRINGPKIHCRLCDRDISGQPCQLLYDYNENMETRLGRKINIILNSTCNYTYLSNYCCSSCTSKIQICFSLLVEIQASDEVIRQTYEHLSDGSIVNTSTQSFLCEECKTTITGIKKFIRHYESHILKKTIVGSRRDLKITDIVPMAPKENVIEGNIFEVFDTDDEKTFDETPISKPSAKCEPVNWKAKSQPSTPMRKNNSPFKTIPKSVKTPSPVKKVIEISPKKPNTIVNDFIVTDNKNAESDDTLTDLDHFGDDFNSGKDAEDGDNKESDEDESIDLEKAIKDNELKNMDFVNNENVKNLLELNVKTDDELSGENLSKSEKDAESDVDSCDSDDSYQKLVSVIKNEIKMESSSEEEEETYDHFDSNGFNMDNDSDNDEEDENEETETESKGKFSCNSCSASFEYKFLLVHHFMKDHNWSKVFDDKLLKANKKEQKQKEEVDLMLKSCRYCKECFETVELKKHSLICKQRFFEDREILCPDCGKMFTYKKWISHRRHHETLPHPDGWPCELCGQRFRAKRFLKSHYAKHDESKKKICEICGKKLLPLSFFSHMLKHREKKHICQHCGKGFTYQYSLRIHLRVHDPPEEPDGKTLKRKQKLICWFCREEFIGVEALNDHLKQVHNAEGSKEDSRFPCSKCEKRFADIFSLKAHLKLIHEIKDEEISDLKSLPIYRHIECNICRLIFNSENKVRVHLKKDHGLKPFEMEILKKECEKCGKKFASKQNLIHHINAAHLHIKPMTCDICQEKFAKHSSLIYHKLRHTGEKPFQCEFCLKSYRQRNDVIRHLARHVRDKELNLEEASAINNSPSPLVMKRRIFLKDSSINYQTVVRKSRSRAIKPQQLKTEEITTFQVVGEEEEPMLIEGETIMEEGETIQYEQEDGDQIEFTTEQIHIETEPKMEYDENVNESLMYVEEIAEDDGSIDASNVQYVAVEPVYDEEKSTIILSSPDQFKSQLKDTFKNVTYRLIPSQLKYMPAVIVKKQEQL